MTAAAATPVLRSRADLRRARIIGVVYLAMAAFVLWVFFGGSSGDAAFLLSPAGESPVLRFALPARGIALVAVFSLSFLGGMQLTRGFGKWTNAVLAVGILVFLFSFMAWAAAGAGREFSLVGMLKASVLNGVPITFGALSGVLSERVAVINIGIEGMLLAGAFVGALVGSWAGEWIGLVGGILIGGILAWVLAVLSIKYQVDQIIAGVVINIFVLGITSFLSSQVLVPNPDLNVVKRFPDIEIPLLGDIPVLGPMLFRHNIFVYAMYLVVAASTYGLFKTRWGLRARAVGEHPKAADTLGIDVFRTRYISVIIGGMVAGLGGAYLTLGSVGRFDENMSAGRGFIGLAAMIFGRWHPVGALAAALVFGFADALQQRMALLNTGIPSEFLLMAPYIATLIVVAGLVGKARPPAADGQPYVKE